MNRLSPRLAVDMSLARVPAVALVAVGSVLVLSEPVSSSRWLGSFGDTGMYLSVISFAIGGSFFSLSGYRTGAQLGTALRTWRTTRGGGEILATRAFGDLFWLVLGLGIVQVTAYARTALLAGSLSADGWSLSMLGLSSATACYAVGLLLGTLIRRIPGIFLAAVFPYGVTLASSQMQIQPAVGRYHVLLGPFIDQSWWPSLVPAHAPIVFLSMYCLLVAGTAWLLAARLLPRVEPMGRRVSLVVPVLLVAVAVGLTTQVSADDYYEARSAGYSCTDDGRVCAWDRNRTKNLRLWRAGAEELDRALAHVPHRPLAYAEAGGEHPADMTVVYPVPGRLNAELIASWMLDLQAYRISESACDSPASSAVLFRTLREHAGRALAGDSPPTAEQLDVQGCSLHAS